MLANEDNIGYILMCLQGSDEVATDTETTGLNVHNKVDWLMGLCFSVKGMECYVPMRHKTGNLPKRYWDHLQKILETKDLIWHNRKFDMHSIATLGWDPLKFTGKQYDTLMIAQLINEELYSKELDALAKKFLGKEKHKKDEVNKFGDIFGRVNLPPEMYEYYGAQDAVLTRELKEFLWPELVRQELESVYWDTEEPYTRLLYKLEQRGIGTNPNLCEEKSDIGRSRMATITRKVGFNPASPNQLGEYLIGELGLPVLAHTDSCIDCHKRHRPIESHTWRASFNKRVMEDYDDILQSSNNPTARLVGEYRGWQKAVTSLYEPTLEKVGPDGFLRTEFKQHGTVTGRLSSRNPNLQQVPRSSTKPWNGDAKSAFNSGRDGFKLFGWDYSQLELRLAAAYGSETLLLTEFEQEKADPFSVLAPLVFGTLTEDTRQWTKTFVYANLYGAGIPKIASQLGRTIEETRGLYHKYHASIPGIMEVSSRVTQLVEQRSYVKYWDGRRRHIRSKADAYKAWNSLCQGGGAQLVKKAMLRCEEFEDPNECMMVLQVHDEITFVIREDLIPKYEPLIKHAMTDWPQLGVRLTVEGKEWK